jgi:hypothetical protein
MALLLFVNNGEVMTKHYCKKHKNTTLEYAEVEGYNYATDCSFSYDVEFCPVCFEEYSETGKMENNVVFDDFTSKVQPEELNPWESI